MSSLTLKDAYALAAERFRAGDFAQAEQLCRQILAQLPDQSQTLHLLGLVAQQASQLDAAVDLLGRAVVLAPQAAEFHNSLGNALRQQRRFDQARAEFEAALRINPGLSEVHNNLGLLLLHEEQFDAAIKSFDVALKLNPRQADTHMNLGDVLRHLRRRDEAIAAYRKAVELNPKLAKALNNLSSLLLERDEFDKAADAARRAISINPDYVEAHDNLGVALQRLREFEPAIIEHRTAIRLKPDHASAYTNLGVAMQCLRTFDDAIDSHRKAVEINPGLTGAYVNLGNALKEIGELDEAIAVWRKAIALDPNCRQAWDDLIYTMHFHPANDSQAIREEQRRWCRQFVDPLSHSIRPHQRDRNPDRRLRVGYVSPDFYAQAECLFVLPLLESHDHSQFEIHCYSSTPRPDEITQRLQKAADVWHDARQLADAELAEKIAADQIDILVDLTMHMTGSRLLVFARKPAPIQVSWLAYPGSTGLETIDYRLTDAHMDPIDADLSWSAEIPIRLPDCWCCYQPIDEMPPVSPLPAGRSGSITFGSFNNFCKINAEVLELWSRVLLAVPESRLMLLCPAGRHRQKLLGLMQSLGVEPDRIELIAHQPRADYLELYHRTDLVLDPFPYNGITTSCDALWMGVPVLTLPGQTPASRAGLGLLRSAGLGEFIASSEENLIQLATDLARNLTILQEIRAGLRDRVQNSPLSDGKRFVRFVELEYRKMWHHWL